jgi:quercetin dioxygenase-like cupin family protein
MQYTRIYADASGESHFADVDIELHEAAYAPPAPPFFVSEPSPATAVAWTTIPKGWSSQWHTTPRLQWWFQLAGEVEVSTSDGKTRRFVAGSIVLLEDIKGRGHTTRVVGNEDVVAVYAHIPD